MKKIKVGVAGLGFIGPAHIEALRRQPDIEVVAINDFSEEYARSKADSLGIEKSFGNFDNMLADPDIEVVHICTPNFLHYPMAKAALLAGKHVVCEKPLANTVAEAQELVELAAKTGLVNAIHFNLRYYPLIRHMRTMRVKGELGNVHSVIGSYLQDWLFYATDYNWRLEPDKSGESRAIADIGSHLIDLIEYITGLEITAVMADFSTVHPNRKKPTKPIETYSGKMLQPEDYQEVPINTEDYATVMIRFNDGSKGVVTVSQVSAGRKNRLSLEISGSNQTVSWCSESPNNVWIGKRDSANEVLMRDPALVHKESAQLISFPGGHNEGFPDTSKQLFKEVYAAVREGKQPAEPSYPTFADGLRELILCDKIIESNKKQAWVQV
ncbi:Gfo/Idh/MocA family protein [Adhaeribacter radiodurans]|uniref:Gfo/Idh/MocA family oxidoreductase n=1 Tax=Adhaeribacter radiodurans TaxID=2745197 RepID=A0A7L7L6K9_9BACT|nr:Gfo/Idh/MocA family oxidoreductase [Adhaeribacter radiodurans]QMU28471.1 Gfo/Idh/MocA family oxidoreductase [Adhaeribacter radiodurans]